MLLREERSYRPSQFPRVRKDKKRMTVDEDSNQRMSERTPVSLTI
jgi:hypothetical protein